MNNFTPAKLISPFRKNIYSILFAVTGLMFQLSSLAAGNSGVICYQSPTKPDVTASQTWVINPGTNTVTIRTTLSPTFVDNTYGSNTIGWTTSHTFGNLTGSDMVQVALFDAAGVKKLEFKIDYLSSSNTSASGYTTLGVLGGDGRMITGSASSVLSVETSLSKNFNTYGYILTTNSPATDANYTPNASYPNWIYEVWYEVTVDLSVFGTAGFGRPEITDVHASPSKTGNNTEVVDSIPCNPGPSCYCNLSYPDNSNLPCSAVEFNENEILRAASPGPADCATPGSMIKLWYNDEHAMVLGVRSVIVKTSSGTTTTNYPITPTPPNPTCADHPIVGTTVPTGDQSGNDVAGCGGRPLWPALFITDLTVNGATSRAGDWQQGGVGVAPHKVCGTWKGAVRTVDRTRNPAVVTVTPDADPVKNNWLLGSGGDTPPGGFGSLVNQGYGAEVAWSVDELGLIPGHSYRLQFMVHDGDQNKDGGDVGMSCTTIHVPIPCPNVTAVASPPVICEGASSTLSYTPTANTTVVGWFLNNGSAGCIPSGSSLGTGATLTVNPTVTTTYSVVVANTTNTCFDTACVTVTVNPRPTLTLTAGPVCATNQQTYSITLAIGAGTGPFTATATAGTAVVTGNTVTISGIPSGSGTSVIVTDANGCQSLPYIQQPHTCSCPVIVSISCDIPSFTICQGESAQLLAQVTGGVPPYIYRWTPNIGNGPGPYNVSPRVTTTYQLIVTDDNGNGCSDTAQITIIVHEKPEITASASPSSICLGSSSTLSVSTLSPGVSIVGWFATCPPSGTSLGSGNTLVVSPTATTTYSVIGTNAFGCKDTACVTVTVNPTPSLTLLSGPECATNQLTYSIKLTISSGTGPFTATATNGTATVAGNIVTVSGIPSGLGTSVTVVDAKGCQSGPYVQTPHSCSCPVIAVISSDDPDNTICQGESVTLKATVSGGVLPYIYRWTPNLGNGAGPFTVFPTATTTYQLIVTDDNGNGCSDTTQLTITVHEKPDLTASASPSAICLGSSSTLSASTTTPGVSIVGWFATCPPSGASLGNTASLVVSPATATNYSVIATTGFGCLDTACVTVSVYPTPVLTLLSGPECATNQLSYSIKLTISSGTGPFTAIATNGTATVAGNIVTVSGILSGLGTTVTVIDANGCRSNPYIQAPHSCSCPVIATISSSDPDNSICQGESVTLRATVSGGILPYIYRWTPNIGNGAGPFTVTPSATTTYTLIVTDDNGNGCSDTTQLTITVHEKPDITATASPAVICQGASSTLSVSTTTPGVSIAGWFNGCPPSGASLGFGSTLQVTPGNTSTYSVIATTGFGCLDTACVTVKVNPSYSNINIDTTICEGSSVTLGGNSYTLSGNYHINLHTTLGCDSIINLNLTVNPKKHTDVRAVICFGEHITVGGQVFTTSVTDSIIILRTSKGCDSIITLNLQVLQQDTIVTNRVICQGQSAVIGDSTFTRAGTYYIPFRNNQCTGIVKLILVVNDSTLSNIDREICEGGVTVVGGHVFNTAGTYRVVIPNSKGCDSIITLTLRVNPKKFTTLDTAICRGESIVVGTQTFNATGTYSVLLFSSKGCDSTVTLNLIVLTAGDTSIVNQSICDGDSATVGGRVFKIAGTYYIDSISGRCTNVIQLNLSVRPTSTFIIERSICQGQALVVGGQTFTQTGTYTVTLQNSVGCDSIITLYLNVEPGGVKSQLDTTICFGGSVTFAGQTFSTTGTYEIIFPSGVCRDTLLLNLTVLPKIEVTIERTICEGTGVTLGGNTFTLTGLYTVTIPSTTGCDSIIHLNLTVNPVKRTNIDAVLCQGEQVIVGGQVFTSSITNHIITLQTSQGCDSIITLNLVVLNSDTTVTDRAICAGDFVDIGGHIFNTAGTHYITFTNGQCTGTVQLNLTVNQPTSSIVNQTICEGGIAVIGGHVFNASGTYTIIIPNSLGCDSVIKLNLTVTPVAHTTIDTIVCSGQGVTVGGQLYASTGTYTVRLTGAQGCDSIVTLNLAVLTAGDTTVLNQSICRGDVAIVNGLPFTAAGTYYIASLNGACNAIIKLNLTVREPSDTTLNVTLCEGGAIVVGGQTFTTTGTYVVNLQNSAGCDSIVTLHLDISTGGVKSQTDTTICFGSSVTFAGQTFSTTGTYQIIYPANVCRDTLLLNLTVLPKIEVTIDRTICEGESVSLGGNAFTLTGLYTVTISNATGCDSTIHLNLTVNPVKRTNIDAMLCQGEQVIVGGQVFTSSITNHIITLQTSQGCDSIITLNIVVLNSDTTITDRAICAGDFVDIGGHIFNTAGTHYITFTNGQCTGTVQLNLTVNQPTSSIVNQTICEGGIAVIGGHVFNASGTYTIIIPNSFGCDSVIKLNLTVTPKAHTTIDTLICAGETVTVGPRTFNTTGTYTVTLTGAQGCDSIITLNLAVLINGDTTDLQQSICAGDSITIGGQTFSAAGTYFIPVTNGRCASIIALNLGVRQPSATTVNKAICEGGAVVVGGQTFTTSGTYVVTLQNSVGCDSIVTLILDVSQGGVKSQTDTTICFGETVSFAGQTFSTTGTYQIIYPVNVCRDTLLLNLTVLPKLEVTIERTICEGESVSLGGNAFTLTGLYTVTIPSSTGCDSTVHLNLKVNPVKHTNIDAVICDGERVVVGGQVFTSSVTNRIITLQTSEQCDSIITVNVVVLDFDTTVTNRTICAGDFVDIGGHIFTTAGTHYITFTNGQCTGTVQLNLTVNQPSNAIVDQTICEGGIAVIAGHVFSTSGTYTIIIPNSLGCDSIIKLNLTVNPTGRSTIDTAICAGESVTIGTRTYTASGTYNVPLAGALCDSVVTLNLTVLIDGDTTDLNQTICSGDSIVIGGQAFTAAGTYFIPVSNGRCSSIVALNLGVRAPSDTTLNVTLCDGQAIVIGGQTFTTSGTYTVALQNSVGCDSIVTLNLIISNGGTKTQVDTTICFGHTFTFAGQTFSSTGTYQIIYPVDVCRDTLLLNLIVDPKIEVTIERNICEGGSVVVGGNAFSLTGDYTIMIPDQTGLTCDSTIHLHLIVRPVKRTNVDAVLCRGEHVIVGGQTFDSSVTNRIITLQTSEGCDSIITLNLIVLNSDTTVTDRAICSGDFVDIGGHIFNTAGTHYITFTNGQCTGTVQLNLTVNQPTQSEISRTICEGDIAVIAGHVYNSTGKYIITIPNSAGCDSVITLNLDVNPIGRSTIDTVVCYPDYIFLEGQIFNTTGTYQVTTAGAFCDSIITLNLVVLFNGDTTALDQSICAGDSITIAGQVFSAAGTYFIPVVNGNCTGTIALDLSVRQPSASTLNVNLCEGGAVVVGGQTYTVTGTYTITLQNAAGCDSIVTLNLDIANGGTKTRVDSTICFGDTVTFAGQSFSTSGTYQIIYPVAVCRDTLLLVLTVNNLDSSDFELVVCDTVALFHGQIFPALPTPVVFPVRVPNAGGCDSIVMLTVVRNANYPLCDQITKIIIDTIPIKTDTIHCDIQRDTTSSNISVTACDSTTTAGTSNHGTWEIVNGCFVFHGGPIKGTDSFCVLACDTITNVCGETTIYITLTGFPPVAVNDTTKTDPNTPINIHVLNNDTTYDEDPLTLCSPDAIVTQPVHGTVAVNADGTITYTPAADYLGIDSFQYQICDPEGRDSAWVFVTTAGCEIPNAFSPNGDGINDYFVIPCALGDIEFSVYNRWGIEVYRNDHYANDWDGLYKGSPLPDGTYYYVLKYNKFSGEEVNKAGFITLHR